MTSPSNRLRLFGLIQDLQKEASDLGLTRTAAALEVTGAVAMEELSDSSAQNHSVESGHAEMMGQDDEN